MRPDQFFTVGTFLAFPTTTGFVYYHSGPKLLEGLTPRVTEYLNNNALWINLPINLQSLLSESPLFLSVAVGVYIAWWLTSRSWWQPSCIKVSEWWAPPFPDYIFHPKKREDYTDKKISEALFVGRERELSALEVFCADDAPVSWWRLYGRRGTGKTRAADQLCLQLSKKPWYIWRVKWHAGIMKPGSLNALRSIQKLKRNTLIVIDECDQYDAALWETLGDLLSEDEDCGKKLRILLVDLAPSEINTQDQIRRRALIKFQYKKRRADRVDNSDLNAIIKNAPTRLQAGDGKITENSLLARSEVYEPFPPLEIRPMRDPSDLKRIAEDASSREFGIEEIKKILDQGEGLPLYVTLTALDENLNVQDALRHRAATLNGKSVKIFGADGPRLLTLAALAGPVPEDKYTKIVETVKNITDLKQLFGCVSDLDTHLPPLKPELEAQAYLLHYLGDLTAAMRAELIEDCVAVNPSRARRIVKNILTEDYSSSFLYDPKNGQSRDAAVLKALINGCVQNDEVRLNKAHKVATAVSGELEQFIDSQKNADALLEPKERLGRYAEAFAAIPFLQAEPNVGEFCEFLHELLANQSAVLADMIQPIIQGLPGDSDPKALARMFVILQDVGPYRRIREPFYLNLTYGAKEVELAASSLKSELTSGKSEHICAAALEVGEACFQSREVSLDSDVREVLNTLYRACLEVPAKRGSPESLALIFAFYWFCSAPNHSECLVEMDSTDITPRLRDWLKAEMPDSYKRRSAVIISKLVPSQGSPREGMRQWGNILDSAPEKDGAANEFVLKNPLPDAAYIREIWEGFNNDMTAVEDGHLMSLAMLRLHDLTEQSVDIIEAVLIDQKMRGDQRLEIFYLLGQAAGDLAEGLLVKLRNSGNKILARMANIALRLRGSQDADDTIMEGLNAAEAIEAFIISQYAHLIHKLKAKDSTERWTYYFIFVRPEKEIPFMKAIGGDGMIYLEDFGKVVASCYGEKPDDKTRKFLKDRFGFDV